MKKILTTALLSLSLFVILSGDAHAGFILNRPLYIGLGSGLVGYWSFDPVREKQRLLFLINLPHSITKILTRYEHPAFLSNGVDGPDMAENQKPRIEYGVFGVDPARLALASSGANADMLLHTPQARAHAIYLNKKNPFFKGFLL